MTFCMTNNLDLGQVTLPLIISCHNNFSGEGIQSTGHRQNSGSLMDVTQV